MIEKLALISVLTSLCTEGVKKLLDDTKIKYSSNVLASIISVILSIGVQWYTCIDKNAAMTPHDVSQLVALILLSFLTSTVGYDKVVKSIKDLRA